MNAQKGGFKKTIVFIAIGVFLLFINKQAFGIGLDLAQEGTVQIGEWVIRSDSFNISENPVWNGSAIKDIATSIGISIYKDPNARKFMSSSEENGVEINVSGLGNVLFNAEESKSASQRLLSSQPVRRNSYDLPF